MKIDVYKHKERYLKWKGKYENSDLEDISKNNSDIIKNYIFNMERGANTSNRSPKGSRGYSRLNTLKQRLIFLAKTFEKRSKKDLNCLEEEEVLSFFNEMRNGTIKRKDGNEYQSTADFVKIFKAFWHWYIKINRKNGDEISDITTDLDTSYNKPKWVYLTEAQIKKLCDNAKYEYNVLIRFLYCSGIRSPSELVNIKVSDFYDDFKKLKIRDEISKTFGRKIKLLKSGELIKEYVENKDLKSEDYVFPINPVVVNRYLKRLAQKVFGDGISEAGKKFGELTLYDFRHCSCCYWLPRYKSESALKYRFGWKKSDKIHYYSELLGMKDTISEEDLLVDVTKTELEKRLSKSETENILLKERFSFMEEKIKEIQKFTDALYYKFGEKK